MSWLRNVTMLLMLVGAASLLSEPSLCGQEAANDDSWKKHPALVQPDGQSHRGDAMVAADIKDPRILKELGRRFRETKAFEDRQEYLLRLLDYLWLSKQRIVGMKKGEVEELFGPLGDAERASVAAGRDRFYMRFKEGRVIAAYYAMGY